MTRYIGQTINNYRLLKLLGHGSYAEVYLGEHNSNKKYGAIKLLHAYITDDGIKETFLREAHLITELKHPNIIQLIDVGFDNTTPFLIMSYVTGGSLRNKYPRDIIIPPDTILHYARQLSGALQYAHDKNIIHCDIKPENLLLDDQNNAILSDFGIAHIVQSTRIQTTHNPEGTPIYMAPEQFKGRPRRESDQYALAIVIYEWFCGEPPFKGKTYLELMERHLHSIPPSPRLKNPTISYETETILLKALAKDPKKRFSSIQEFAKKLEESIQSMEDNSRKGKNIINPNSRLHINTFTSSIRRSFLQFVYQPKSILVTIVIILIIAMLAMVVVTTTRAFLSPQNFNLYNTPSQYSGPSLESQSRTATININGTELLNNYPNAISQLKEQVKNIQFLQNRKAGLVSVTVRAASNSVQDIQQAINVANKITDILKTMKSEDAAFSDAVFGDVGTTTDTYIGINSVDINVYLFK